MEWISHPLTYAMAAVLGFFLKDLFNRVQRTGEIRSEVDALRVRIVALELSHKEHSEMAKAVIRLEEQVKRLSEDIKYFLNHMRTHPSDKADPS